MHKNSFEALSLQGGMNMRIAIISDIHGNAVALEAVLNGLKTESIDHIVCLGDTISAGPQPCEVIAQLKSLNDPVVMGNMDVWCLDPHPGRGKSKNAKRGNEVRFWGVRKLSPDDLDYMRTFQAMVEIPLDANTNLLCYHGSPRSNEDGIASHTSDEEMERMLSGYHAMVLAGGHTHTQMVRYYGDSTIVNPGVLVRLFPHRIEYAGFFEVHWMIHTIGDILPGQNMALLPGRIRAFVSSYAAC